MYVCRPSRQNIGCIKITHCLTFIMNSPASTTSASLVVLSSSRVQVEKKNPTSHKSLPSLHTKSFMLVNYNTCCFFFVFCHCQQWFSGGLVYSHDLQTCDWPRNVACKPNIITIMMLILMLISTMMMILILMTKMVMIIEDGYELMITPDIRLPS